ncbi:MAG: 4a-hydroxytetrahydrobiopterin dehydratase [Alphaproteobacteria bacterium]|nr:4a-hydroxytetrahydrobiopterin dehydratase [Alphaproteobacteria bacterium]
MNHAKISPQILERLAASGWIYDEDEITKKLVFQSFADAFAFMAACMPEIERLNHHPEWSNVYNKVTVSLTTHDAGGVTAKDVELAEIMDRIAAKFLSKA